MQIIKTIVAHNPASGPKSPPDISSFPLKFKLKMEPATDLLPLTLNPKIFPWEKFQDAWIPHTTHRLFVFITHSPKNNPTKIILSIAMNDMPGFSKWTSPKTLKI